jgi:mRNA-degrading endonuclease toxin of MazEF toxin-antitoxin module
MAGKFTSLAMSLVRQHGPRLLRELTKSSTAPASRPAPSGRPAPSARPRSAPTADRSRRIDYSPVLDGAADPGEIVWTWVEFEEDAGQGKDRPVLVVGRDDANVLGLMLSSQSHRRDDSNWVSIGTGDWDRERRESFVRLDRVLDIPENGIRREGAILPRGQFDRVAEVLRRSYDWQ